MNGYQRITTVLSFFLIILLVFSYFTPKVSAASEVRITGQPQDIEVAYPSGAQFSVTVNDASLVASYRWYITDQNGNLFELDDISAKTDTLVIPSTVQGQEDLNVTCIITDINGSRTTTKSAVLSVTGRNENKPVLYVGDFSVEPGQSLDLSKTCLGSGVITYDTDCSHVRFDSVIMSNARVTYDTRLSPAKAIFFNWYGHRYLKYISHLSATTASQTLTLTRRTTAVVKYLRQASGQSGMKTDPY